MSEDGKSQQDVALSPGTLLKAAREAHELSLRDVADRLHLMPGYPAIIEDDEFHALRHPAFARGYVKAYGKLLGVDETRLLDAFDRLQAEAASPEPRKVRTRPLQLQHTGVSVIVGLLLLVLLVVAIWWWRAEPVARAQATLAPVGEVASTQWERDLLMTGDT